MNATESFYYTTDVIEKILPERLKFFRKRAQLTTYDVGNILNKTPSAVTLWETGKTLPDVETLLEICNIYKISDFNELVQGDDMPETKKLTKTEQELIKLWRSSKPHIRAAFKTILKECNKE